MVQILNAMIVHVSIGVGFWQASDGKNSAGVRRNLCVNEEAKP